MSKMKVAAAVISACALCLALAGCGGGQSSSSASASASSSASSSASQASSSAAKSAAVTEQTIVGDWQLGVAEADGARMTGDLSQMGVNWTLTFNSDKSTTMSIKSSFEGTDSSDNSISGTWSFEGGKAHASYTNNAGTQSELDFTANDDGTITTVMPDVGTLIFQREPSKAEHDPTNAKPVTDIASIAGDYTIAGAYMMGVCIMGDVSAFGMGDTTLSIKADGSAEYKTGGTTVSMSLTTANGATTANLSGVECPVTMTDGMLTLDMTSALGGAMSSATFFKKI